MKRLLAGLILGVAAAVCVHAGDKDLPAAANPAPQILVLLHIPPEHFRPDSNYSGSYGDGLGRAARRRIATQLARQHGLRLASDWPIAVLGIDCYVMNLPPEQATGLSALVLELARDPRVEWAQAMNVYRTQGHNDPLYAVQPAATEWHLSELHERTTGRGVRVAVVDSAIEVSHPDLAGQIEINENFVARPLVAERHGTEVAGIIAARADNRLGIAGIAPRSQLLALRACWQETTHATLCNSLSLARALDFAIIHNAQVINLSLSGPPDRLLGKLIDAALARDIAVVAAVDRTLPDGGFPASHPGVVAVADESPGPLPSAAFIAPGHDVPTTGPPSRWYFVSGASFAAAHVSGLLALLLEGGKLRAPPLAGAALVRTPAGRIDACATVSRGLGECACACSATSAVAPLALH